MASASGNGKVWEWQRDDGGYSPFPPDDSAKIEVDFSTRSTTCTLSGGDRLDFNRLVMVPAGRSRESSVPTRVLASTRHCICIMYVYIHLPGRERPIRRTTITLPLSPPIHSYWTWNERGTTFVPYCIDAIVDIESAYQQTLAARGGAPFVRQVDLSVCSSQLPYTINFSEMKQTRHGYGTKRTIQRVPIQGGHSLQTLLQYPLPITGGHSFSSNLGLLTTSAGAESSVRGSFSLTCGPATHIAKATTGNRGSASSSGSYPAIGSGSTASVSYSKPSTTRKGRGKKSISLGKGGKRGELHNAMNTL